MNTIFVQSIMLSAVHNQNNHNNEITIINSCTPKTSAVHNKLINRSNKIYITNRSKPLHEIDDQIKTTRHYYTRNS
jgi:hypothetical protein